MPVALVTDSSAYLSQEQARSLGVTVVPLHVTLGDWSFDEGTVAPAVFYARLRAAAGGVTPTTSQPSPGEFVQAFAAAAAAGADRVLCVTCGRGVSGTYSSAVLAARLAPLPVDVVDSGTISGGLLLVVSSVGRRLLAGDDADTLLALARSLGGRVRSTWSSDTHQLLAAGGRSGAVTQEAGVPVLALDGTIRVLGHARTDAESVELQAAVVRAALAEQPGRVSVGHGDVPHLADALADALAGAPGLEGIDRYVVGPVVGAHAGPGSYGANYLGPA